MGSSQNLFNIPLIRDESDVIYYREFILAFFANIDLIINWFYFFLNSVILKSFVPHEILSIINLVIAAIK
jgi:hypothetical protein